MVHRECFVVVRQWFVVVLWWLVVMVRECFVHGGSVMVRDVSLWWFFSKNLQKKVMSPSI